jgi:hypothetical protein
MRLLLHARIPGQMQQLKDLADTSASEGRGSGNVRYFFLRDLYQVVRVFSLNL